MSDNNGNGYRRRRTPDSPTPLTKTTSRRKSPHIDETLTVLTNNGNGNGGKVNDIVIIEKFYKDTLTPNQKIFADEWLKDRNGVRSYKVAFPNVKSYSSAGVMAFNLLKNLKVETYIQKRLEEINAKAEISQEWLLHRYKMLADYKMSDFFYDDGSMKPFSEIPEEKLYAIQGFKAKRKTTSFGKGKDKQIVEDFIKEFDLPKKRSVLDSIAKLLGLNVEKDDRGGGTKLHFNAPVQIIVGMEE
ncbi:MAG TPA: terminase small subunit [bacterium]|nr:terminase small subunit [bacterium]